MNNEQILRKFVADCRAAGFKPRPYAGRGYYFGFGVDANQDDCLSDVPPSPTDADVMRATSCDLRRDSMGKGIILYPTASLASSAEMYTLAEELGLIDDPDKAVCLVDVDTAEYIGDSEDGVYFAVAAKGSHAWYWSALVDSDSAGFVASLVEDAGPYESQEAAHEAARDRAREWCHDNDVTLTTRCWVTLRLAVDVEPEGDRPTDEEVREALNLQLSDYAVDRDHITWGVEGEDEED